MRPTAPRRPPGAARRRGRQPRPDVGRPQRQLDERRGRAAIAASRCGSTLPSRCDGDRHPEHEGRDDHAIARCVTLIACFSLPISGNDAAVHQREVAEREARHRGRSPRSRAASARRSRPPSPARGRVRTGRALRCPASVRVLARSAMKMIAARTVSAIARCASRARRRGPASPPLPRAADWTMTRTPATTAAASSGRSSRRALKTVISPTAATSGPTKAAATSRWECSIQAWSSTGGSQSPKHSGQSGQPRPESWRARARRRRSGRRSPRQRQPRAGESGQVGVPRGR